MKFFGWLYLTLLAVFQLIGWYVFGRPSAWTALMVIVLPSSILSGSAFFGFYFWNRSWVLLPVVMLMFIEMEVSHSSRYAPRSALLRHAMTEFLERNVGSWESYIGGMVLLCCMFMLAAVAAFGTAEGYRLITGRTNRGGRALFSHALRSLPKNDKKVAGGKDDEA